ncbi:MAG: Coenzyme F420 hydrogenase/dehydrogenase, beta subunit C-terminal domain [Chloroflexi bacterium]|nr:Coenzyme F420 hydrogenase/dehydrogenase, beta subunit C-terminal domain [Chloroflexota bacterium]
MQANPPLKFLDENALDFQDHRRQGMTDFDRLVADVVDQDLCLQCGVCVGICPVACLEMRGEEHPLPALVQGRECVDCTLCVRACPREHEYLEEYSIKLFGRAPTPDELAGAVKETYGGHMTDRRIWKSAAGGGLISGLSIYLLESGRVDGVIMCGMSETEPWKVIPRIVRNRDEMLANTSSHYVTVPINQILQQIRLEPHKKYALVGSGCHINGIRNAQFAPDPGPEMVKQIIFTMGLMCGGNRVPGYTLQLLRDMGINEPREVTKFSFRGGAGSSAIAALKNGEVRGTLGHFGSDIRRLDPLYESGGCTLCIDFFANLADITIGDYMQKMSIAFVRSDLGVEVMHGAIEKGYVDVDPTIYDFDGNRHDRIRHNVKKRVTFTLIDDRKRKELPHPDYGASYRDPSSYWRSEFDRRFFLLLRWLAKQRWFRAFYTRLPVRLQWGFGVVWASRQLFAGETWPNWSGLFGKITSGKKTEITDQVLDKVLERQRKTRDKRAQAVSRS